MIMKQFRSVFFIVSILAITALALGLRLRAVDQLPIDYDEDDYLGAAQRYAQAIKAGDVREIMDYEFNYEHPPLTKIVYGLSILHLPEEDLIPERPPTASPASSLPEPHFQNARLTSAVFGTLEVFALALLNPPSALLLGIHTWQIKYTSQIMLEPLPALTSLLVVLFYWQACKNGLFQIHSENSQVLGARTNSVRLFSDFRSLKRPIFWLALSAVALGITAASKYTYAIVGLVIIVDIFLDVRRSRSDLPTKWGRAVGVVLAWGLLAILVFWALNPRLWTDPIARIQASVFYHSDYAQSEHVENAGFPAWQQLVWLAGPVRWHPGVFLVTLDLYILIFAIVGFKHFWRQYRVFALWLLIAGIFLLAWPTKWPQYLLTISAPLCLSSAIGIRKTIWEPLKRKVRQEKLKRSQIQTRGKTLRSWRLRGESLSGNSWRELRRAWLWLLPGTIALILIAFYPLIYQAAMALTDFNTMSILDGINGGVWREFWRGITGQVEAVDVNLWEFFNRFRRPTSTEVHFAGFKLLGSLLLGILPDLLVFNIMWTVLSVGLQAALGITVAVMLSRDGLRLRRFWRTLFILPWAIPEFVGALIWLRLLEPGKGWLAVMENSPFESFLATFLDNPNTTLILLLVAATWYGFPFVMLAATAGLKMVPKEVYEAAAIDGAGRLSQFRYITWPLLWPLVMPAILIRSIFAFNQFYLFYTIQSFPLMTFATLSYFAFSPTYGGQFAISAAINMFTVIVLVVLILWFNRISRATEGVTYA